MTPFSPDPIFTIFTIFHLRIGNCLGTWQREIQENDFTSSGVLTYALNSKLLKIKDLKTRNKSLFINQIKNSKFEKKLFEEWEKNYRKISEISKKIKEINIETLVSAIEKITFYHLVGRGKI